MVQRRMTLGVRLLFAIGLMVLFAACRHMKPSMNPTIQSHAACSGGHGKSNPYGPIICVDEKTLDATPDKAGVIADDTKHGGGPRVINWFTTSGQDILSVVFNTPSDCLAAQPVCHGGHCYAVTDVKAKEGTVCKYTITLASQPGKKNDPDVHIDPCCP